MLPTEMSGRSLAPLTSPCARNATCSFVIVRQGKLEIISFLISLPIIRESLTLLGHMTENAVPDGVRSSRDTHFKLLTPQNPDATTRRSRNLHSGSKLSKLFQLLGNLTDNRVPDGIRSSLDTHTHSSSFSLLNRAATRKSRNLHIGSKRACEFQVF